MSLPASISEVVEYRGVENLVAAEVTADTASAYTTGAVFSIAGVAEISRTTDSSDEAHYYDNQPMVIISSTAADTVTINASAIPLEVFAKITGYEYDGLLGALIEGQRTPKYFALGYKTKDTSDHEIYVWRYKGRFNIPDTTNATINDGTDANGQEITFTGIATTHDFLNGGHVKAMAVEASKNLVDVSSFFATVKTPDNVTALNTIDYPVMFSTNGVQGGTLTVKNGTTSITNGAMIASGTTLAVTASTNSYTVNGAVQYGTQVSVTGPTVILLQPVS